MMSRVASAAARQSGTTAADWIAAKLGDQNGRSAPRPSAKDIDLANRLLRETIVDYGFATGIDNEQIDADLAREYGDDHSSLYENPAK